MEKSLTTLQQGSQLKPMTPPHFQIFRQLLKLALKIIIVVWELVSLIISVLLILTIASTMES